MTPTADQSAAILASKLRAREPFSFWRFGDGFLELAAGRKGMTCDHEPYSEALRDGLLDVWTGLVTSDAPGVYFGDWQAASFVGPKDPSRYERDWQQYFGRVPHEQFLHPEALLLMRESEPLVDFWRAVREDPRRKAYFGPSENNETAKALGCEHVRTRMKFVLEDARHYQENLQRGDWDVLLFGAGLAGMIPAFRCWQRHPERTFIHVGSALDPVGRGRSRHQQLSQARAQALFAQIEAVKV